jgi:prepilin-type N-terminal cleavage/methylation domain-containing protein
MPPSPYRSGFSLIEILIVVAIAASVIMVVGNLGGNVDLLNNLVSQQLQSASDVEQTLQIMMSEIRSAGPSANGAYPIEVAASSSFTFYSDVNKNGVVERIRYFLASSSIYRGVTAPVGTPPVYPTSGELALDVIDNVIPPTTSTPLFSYYDAGYTGTQAALAQPVAISAIRLVGISFAADIKPKQAPGPDYFSTFVAIRNLRSN